jgi:hypothetical protein
MWCSSAAAAFSPLLQWFSAVCTCAAATVFLTVAAAMYARFPEMNEPKIMPTHDGVAAAACDLRSYKLPWSGSSLGLSKTALQESLMASGWGDHGFGNRSDSIP